MGIVYDKVMEDYKNDNVELSSLFFDFSLEDVTFRDALADYVTLQADINGDDIEFLSELKTDDENNIISAIVEDYDKGASLVPVLPLGSNITIAEALTMIGNEYKIYRIMDTEYEHLPSGEYTNKLVGGTILDFIW